ncbi:MAG: ABC transporter permease [Acidobacteriota bacterium]
MRDFLLDLRYGVRRLLRRPGFTIVAIVTLSLGIGANTAIFSVVNGILFRSLPYEDPDRLVLLWEAGKGVRNNPVSHLNFSDWRAQQHSFESISAYTGRWGGPETITGGSEPERAYVVSVYRDFFKVLGVKPALGRFFSPDEERPGSNPVVVASYGFWQRRLGGTLALTDRRLTIDNRSYQVIGVMPPNFSYPADTDLWISREQSETDGAARSAHGYIGIARLRGDTGREQAQIEMTAIAKRIVAQDGSDQSHDDVTVISVKDQLTGSIREALMVLFGAVGLVLLIACANIANLLLARAVSRQKEIAVRAALGAGRGRIVRQLLTESLLLGLTGGVVGLLLAAWLVKALVALGPTTVPRLGEIQVDSSTLLFTLLIALVTSVAFGLFPALRASNPDLNNALKESGRGSSASSGLVRGGLVVAEVALTLVLLIGAGLLTRSLLRVLDINPGFSSANVLTMQVSLPSSEYADIPRRLTFYRQLFERIRAVPGVEAAGMVNNLPMGGVDLNGQFGIAGRPRERYGYGSYRVVDAAYFGSLGIPLMKGRYFSDSDSESTEPVAIISQRVADTFFKGEDPIGQRVLSVNDVVAREEFEQEQRWPKIVGVVGDVRHFGLESRAAADVYFNYAQRSRRIGQMTLTIRTGGQGLASRLRQEVKGLDPHLPVSFEPLDNILGRSTANRRFNVVLLGGFAGLALLLAMIGIYGVMSYAVSQNTREIGIRRALGAQSTDVVKLVVGQGLILAAIGVAIGLVAALALGRLVGGLLYEIRPSDPTTYVGVAALLLAVALFACYVPARRASRIDPMIALRHE